ncbi:hypothetical protein AB0D57_14855 [Streptomyces sp. NPDC048275]|uniref:hypothetical protein n=1 Tax=Streptomyces sp. NPDC048275 TaxID=3155629 RepID=UPI0033E8F68A
MAFPQTPLDVRIALGLSGTWTDITPDAYLRNPISIGRGGKDESPRTDPSSCTLTLNNRHGKYSPRNPLSPLYGQIGRNTPVRVSVHAGSTFLDVPAGNSVTASTPDAAALDITGDLDVRAEVRLDDWQANSQPQVVLAKWNEAVNQRSWMMFVYQRELWLYTSADGTAEHQTRSVTKLAVPPTGRLALRATIDVNNGAGGKTVQFFTAPTLSGPWTLLATNTTSGTTAIFNSTTVLDVGSGFGNRFFNMGGAVYRAEVYNGIGGTLVASPTFTAQTAGTTGFTDSAGRTWSVAAPAAITNRRTRFTGAISSWPSRWDVSGKDVYVPVEAGGITRRLGQGAKELASTLRRRIPTFSPLAYWPLEEGKNATQCYSPIDGVPPLKVSGFDMAATDTLAGSNPLPVIRADSSLSGSVPAPATALTQWHTEFMCYLDAGPTTTRTLMNWYGTGTITWWRLMIDSGGCQIHGYDNDGTELITRLVAVPQIFGTWFRWKLSATQSGGNVNYTILWTIVGESGLELTGSYAGSVGRISRLNSTPHADLAGVTIGHISVLPVAGSTAYNQGDIGFAGETAAARMLRLSSEEALPLAFYGEDADTQQVGPQRPAALLDLLQEAADADGGVFYEPRDTDAVAYRTRAGLYNQTPALALDYLAQGEVAPPLEPVDDDQMTRNDVTVTRDGGSSARAIQTVGPLSVNPPPAGVGIYDESLTLNVFDDVQTEPIAYWRMHLGTWDEARYPSVHVDLAAAPHLIDEATAIDIGDRLTIANLPAWLPPGGADLINRGYAETIGTYDWDITFNCTPAGPWTIAVTDDTVLGKADTDGSVLATAATSTATAVNVLTTVGNVWTTDGAEMPFDVRCGGEVMGVSATSSWLRDTCTRSVSSGWGTPDAGPAWSTVGGGPATDYSVNGSYAVQVLSTVDVSRRTAVTAVHPDFDVYADITTSALATGDSLYGAVTARMQDSGNMYMVRAEFTTTNTIVVHIRKLLADVNTQVGSTYTLPFTHVAGTFVRFRFQGTGSTLRAKAWLASAAEPSSWHIEGTDSSITAAHQIGTRSIRVTGNTNAATVQIRYDNFDVINPQTFTVTRSENGIVKAQTAGTDVRLATPAIVAL